jgi:NAD(P)-dependent dehydrogenase (short-subunit alcohol dehydrogenase family)
VSKAGVLRLVESVAGELPGTGVAVFAISPGLVATDMTQFPEAFLAHYPDWRDIAQRDGIPPERAAELIRLLATGDYDALSGRFVRLIVDLDVARAAAAAAEEPGTLRVVPYVAE